MYYLNKVIWSLANPTIVLWALIAFGAYGMLVRKPRKASRVLLVGGLALMWLWMTPLTTRLLGLPLEREWLVDGKVPQVESFPETDAIVLLGGSMGGATNVSDYAEMSSNSDRVWQSARLYNMGKAPRIFVTGKGNEWTTKRVLTDFGVPTNAMAFVDQARNTEEEAKAVSVLCSTSNFDSTRPKVLVVTSAWHMRRAKLMFEKYAPNLEVVPAPADFEATVGAANGGINFMSFLPSSGALAANEVYLHEWVGYYWYRWFR